MTVIIPTLISGDNSILQQISGFKMTNIVQSVQVETRRGEGLLFAKCPLGGILQVPVVIIRCLIVQWCALLHDVLITNPENNVEAGGLVPQSSRTCSSANNGKKNKFAVKYLKKIKLPLFLLKKISVAWKEEKIERLKLLMERRDSCLYSLNAN